MKNSFIVNFFVFIIKKFINVYDGSMIERVINSVCLFFKSKSGGSVVCGYFADSTRAGEYWKNSLAFRIVTSPIKFVMFLAHKFSAFFEKSWKNSSLIIIYSNLIHIPLRQVGILGLVFTLGAFFGLLARGVTRINLLTCFALLIASLFLTTIGCTARQLYSSSRTLSLFGRLFNRYSIQSELEEYVYKINSFGFFCILALLSGFVSGVTSVTIFTMALIAAAVMVLVLTNTITGVFLIVMAAPIMPTMVCAGLVALTALSFAIKLLSGNERRCTVTQPSFYIIAFLALAAFSSFTSFNISKSIQAYVLYLVFAAAYFLIVNSIKTRNQWYNLIIVFILAGIVVGLYGIYQNFFAASTDTSWIDEDMFEDIGTRVYSTFDNPNVLGQYLVMAIPVAFAAMWSEKRIGVKIFLMSAAAVMGACLVFTWSRAAWVGIILAIGFFLVMKDRRWASLCVLALLIMPFVLPESIISRITSIGNMKDSSTAYRVSVWIASLRIAADYWLTGIGLGSGAFERVYQGYALNGAGFALHSHNFYIQLVVEMGILGLVLFGMIMVSSYRKIISIKDKNSVSKNILTAMGGALLGYMFQGVAENLWYNYRMILLFWIYLAILHSGAGLADSEPLCSIEYPSVKQ